MNTQKENYILKWVTSLLKRVSRSGLDSITLERAWHHAKNPMIDGVMMADPILHNFNKVEFIEIIQKNFQVEDEIIKIPQDIQNIQRQEVINPNEPFTNRKKFAERLNSASEVNYFDPYIDSKWLNNFNTVFSLISDNKLKILRLLTSDRNIIKSLKRQAFIEVAKAFAEENNLEIEVRIIDKEHPRFFIANGYMWKVGHSLNDIDKFEGIDQQIEKKEQWESFWEESWNKAKVLI